MSIPLDSETSDGTTDREADLELGYGLSGALGYGFGNGFRSEVELGYLNNDVDSITGATGVSGEIHAAKLMGNVLYDFNIANLPVTPYVGLGIGGARIKADDVAPFGADSINDSGVGFAYQAIAGAAHALTDRLSLTVDYRYFDVPDVELSTRAGTDVDAEYATHTVMFGLRYSFGGPARMAEKAQPVAQPAPKVEWKPKPEAVQQPAAPTPPRSYIVFFDWNRANLRDDAKEIIRTAVDNLDAVGGVVRIVLTGHADRSGADAYNQRLSQRRADAVKGELQQLGVTQQEIDTVAKGETEPLVPTDDGVREPRNRRVEVVLQ